PERKPHDAEERPQRSDRDRPRHAEQAQVHQPRAADEKHHAEGMNRENGWKRPDGLRFAQPCRKRAVVQRGHQLQHVSMRRLYHPVRGWWFAVGGSGWWLVVSG